ncbi:MAG: glycosyltransferase family 39 protein [Candidatus Woesearchaeota archaeon]
MLDFIFAVSLIILLCLYLSLSFQNRENYFVNDNRYDAARNFNIVHSLSENPFYYSLIGNAYYKHPPVLFYLLLIPYEIFGSVFSMSVFMSLLSLITVIMIYFFIKELFDVKTAVFTAIFVGFSPLFFMMSYQFMFSIFTVFFTVITVYAYAIAIKKNKLSYFCLAGILGGFMLLTKTVLGIVYIGIGIHVLLANHKDVFRLFKGDLFDNIISKFLFSFLIALLLFSPWVLYQKINNGGYDWLAEHNCEYGFLDCSKFPRTLYFSEMTSQFGYVLSLFIILGLIFFIHNLIKRRVKNELYFFSPLSQSFCSFSYGMLRHIGIFSLYSHFMYT